MSGPTFSSHGHAGATVAAQPHWELAGAAPAAAVLEALRRMAADATVLYLAGERLPPALHDALAPDLEWSGYGGGEAVPSVYYWRVRATPAAWATLVRFAAGPEPGAAGDQLWVFRHDVPVAECARAAGGPLWLAITVPALAVRRWARALGLTATRRGAA